MRERENATTKGNGDGRSEGGETRSHLGFGGSTATTFEKKNARDDSSYNRFAPCFLLLSLCFILLLYPGFERSRIDERKIEKRREKKDDSRNSDSVNYAPATFS